MRRVGWIAVSAVWALACTACPAVADESQPSPDPAPPAATGVQSAQTAPDGSTDVGEPASPPDQPTPDPGAGEQPAPTPAPTTADQPDPEQAAGAPPAKPPSPPSPDPMPSVGAVADEGAAPDGGAAPDEEAAPEAPMSAPPATTGPPGPHTQRSPASPVRAAVAPQRNDPPDFVQLPSRARVTTAADPVAAITVPARSAHVQGASPRTTANPDHLAPAPGFALSVPGVIAVLQAQSAGPKPSAPQRDPGGRAHRPKATPQPRATERDPRPPLQRPSDHVAASAAGAGSTAPPTFWCAIFAACTALTALELRRFGARLLVPDAPGAFSLRDRPG